MSYMDLRVDGGWLLDGHGMTHIDESLYLLM